MNNSSLKNRAIIAIGLTGLLIGFVFGALLTSHYWKTKHDKLDETVPETQKKYIEVIRKISEMELSQLKSAGIENPVDFLKKELIKTPELINYDPVLGGNMGFYSKDDIFVLSNKWVLAVFEDGHISGAMLLRFRITSDKKIEWKVLDSYLF